MEKVQKFLNVGCGKKYHKDWVNIDMVPATSDVIRRNLINGIPFEDNRFDVVYHSQVLEHIPKENAPQFISECYRVLKKGGILRVVVPDLENIVDEYKKHLKKLLEEPGDLLSEANYDWIMLELFDQTVRNYPGGLMADYLRQESLVNEKYVIDRIGFVGRHEREKFLSGKKESAFKILKRKHTELGVFELSRQLFTQIVNKTLNLFLGKKYRVGNFRLSGEIHMWMYDRYSLTRLLRNAGFKEIKIMDAHKSRISNWDQYELDVKDGNIYDPTSLFMEAEK